ncbi:MAG: VCBS repeat-containing protein, partial [Chitinophagales bacterium]|nr:VCBS repeat-containing protein [Chitinophagales bacterium]
MKKPILYIGFAMLNIQIINAQYFTKITEGDIVNTLSDSRSCNWIDFNNDGWQDVQITNGKYPGENNLLYINNGDGTFETIVSGAIVSDLKPSDGATWADHDNDGDIDCFVVNWYGTDNLFYDNNGDETFTQVTVGTIVEDNGYSETASWGDFNNDSYLDIYVSNSGGTKKNYLYKNNGNGTFLKITEGDMVNDNDSTRSVNWVDYDMDGDADIFVTSEAYQHERLYRNNGDETFTSITDNALVTDGGSTMSSSWGDIDNDGDLDVFLANDQGNDALFRNDGDNVFTKLSSDIVCNNGGNSFGSN